MSLPEVAWRVRHKARGLVDQWAAHARRRPVDIARVAMIDGAANLAAETTVADAGLPEPGRIEAMPPDAAAWRDVLLPRAERLSRHKLDLFDLEDIDTSGAIDWNYEYKARKAAPMRFAPKIDYRDYDETGDCKFVWEPSRHQHWVTLGRAYRLTGDARYANAVAQQLESWAEQCPYGFGMNWRSPLELGIRIINWAWAFELIRPSGLLTPERSRLILGLAYRHLWDISRNYSQFSSANNHLIGEAAGVFVGSSAFTSLRRARAWRDESRSILLREIAAQTYADGGNREQAMGYHLFVLEFFLVAGIVARRTGVDFPQEYWRHLQDMFAFLAAMCEGGAPPWFGDADDGYVLDLDDKQNMAAELLAVGAAMFDRGDFKALAAGRSERLYWLLDREAWQQYQELEVSDPPPLASRDLPASGYYLLQSGTRGADDRVSVSFDCGELGFGAIAAHGHADALSITLRLGGRDILVDAGTYDYFTYGHWRNYFRSTRAHNTVEIDGQDQSEMLGSFLWGRRANARCVCWEPATDGGRVTGEHDFGHADGSLHHRRSILLEGHELVIEDELIGNGSHVAALHWHFAPTCQLAREGANAFQVQCGLQRVRWVLDEKCSPELFAGSENPVLGWSSRRYHIKHASPTIRATCTWQDTVKLVTRITLT